MTVNEVSFDTSRLRQILKKTYFFQSLKMNELDELISHIRSSSFKKGAEVIRQGDPGNAFYLIATGRVSVWVKKAFSKNKVAELFPDQFFGEMALISNEPRNATIIAEENSDLFVLYQNDFNKILMKNPAVSQELRRIFNERKQKR